MKIGLVALLLTACVSANAADTLVFRDSLIEVAHDGHTQRVFDHDKGFDELEYLVLQALSMGTLNRGCCKSGRRHDTELTLTLKEATYLSLPGLANPVLLESARFLWRDNRSAVLEVNNAMSGTIEHKDMTLIKRWASAHLSTP